MTTQPNRSGVYQVINTTNGKRYVGSGVSIRGRLASHKSALAHNKHGNKKLQNAWNKYGAECFSFEPVLFCDKQNLILYEQIVMDAHQASANGYNIRAIAESNLGNKLSPQAKAKVSAANIGKKVSLETREKMGAWQVGRTRSEDTKAKISVKLSGREMPERTKAAITTSMTGKKMSPEAVAKAAASHRGKKRSQQAIENMKRGWESRRAALVANPNLMKHSEETKAKMSMSKFEFYAKKLAALPFDPSGDHI